MAVQGFKGLGWFLCGVVVAPACYLVNSHGAAEQAKLEATRLAIVQAQRDIRGLETEFNTRANLARGVNLLLTSAVLFLIFSTFLGGLNLLGEYGAAILLIGLGLYVLVRGFFRSGGQGGQNEAR